MSAGPAADHERADAAGAEAADRAFHRAYRETVDWMYSDSAALKVHADWLGIPEAKRTRDGFFPKEALNPDTIVGLDATAAALSESHLDELIQIPPR